MLGQEKLSEVCGPPTSLQLTFLCRCQYGNALVFQAFFLHISLGFYNVAK